MMIDPVASIPVVMAERVCDRQERVTNPDIVQRDSKGTPISNDEEQEYRDSEEVEVEVDEVFDEETEAHEFEDEEFQEFDDFDDDNDDEFYEDIEE